MPATVTASKEDIIVPIEGADLVAPSIPCEAMASAARILYLDGIPAAKGIVHQQQVTSKLQRLAAPTTWQTQPLERHLVSPRRIIFDK